MGPDEEDDNDNQEHDARLLHEGQKLSHSALGENSQIEKAYARPVDSRLPPPRGGREGDNPSSTAGHWGRDNYPHPG